MMSYLPLLLILLPLLFAAGMLLPIPALKQRRNAWIYSACTSTLTFGLVVFMAIRFRWNSSEIQFSNDFYWLSTLGAFGSYGINNISMLLIMMTACLMPIVVVGSLIEVKKDMRTFHVWLHVLEAALFGTFIARDAIFFYGCFEFTLIPLYFLIGYFGHANRMKAARTFFVYTFTGSVFMLGGMIYVYIYGTQNPANYTVSFRFDDLIAIGRSMPLQNQIWVMLAFMAGLGVKTPLWPFHTWLPLAHTEAPTAGSVDLAGLVLKLGPYGLLMFAFPMLPLGAAVLAPWISIFATLGVVIAALCCWVQTDAKKLVAYSSVSHMGFAILGLFAFDPNHIGATGAMFYMLSHGLATGGLFMCLGMLYDRFHSRDIDRINGLGKIMPVWSFFFGIFIFASVGLPGLSGFIGEWLCLFGAFQGRIMTANIPDWNQAPTWLPMALSAAAGLGVVIAAMYLLRLFGALVFGKLRLPHFEDTGEHGVDAKHDHDLSMREIITLVPLAVACIGLGLFPNIILKPIKTQVEHTLAPMTAELAPVIGAYDEFTPLAEPNPVVTPEH